MQNLLDIDELAAVLGRRPETIKRDLRRNPMAVPPRLHIPGTRMLRWREPDVEAWLAANVLRPDGVAAKVAET
jgi:predicted DNA-binding transcriptional regulator AlpA